MAQLLAQRVRGPASPFGMYVGALPLAFVGVPMFFPGPAVDALQYPPVTQQVRSLSCTNQ